MNGKMIAIIIRLLNPIADLVIAQINNCDEKRISPLTI